MPVTQRDITSGRVNIENYARAHGSLHTLCEPDPQNAPDFDLEPPVGRDIDGVVQGANGVRTGSGE